MSSKKFFPLSLNNARITSQSEFVLKWYSFLSFFLIAFSLYIFISLVSYDISDSGFFNKNSIEIVNNLGGPLGAKI